MIPSIQYKDYKDIKKLQVNNNNNNNKAHVECKNKGDTSNNRSDWDYFKRHSENT